jgi:hypothetical protein
MCGLPQGKERRKRRLTVSMSTQVGEHALAGCSASSFLYHSRTESLGSTLASMDP